MDIASIHNYVLATALEPAFLERTEMFSHPESHI